MPTLHSESLRRKALSMLVTDGCLYACMVGTAETFALFFAVKRGLDAGQIAVISTLPILIGALAQWLVPCRIKGDLLKSTIQHCQWLQVVALMGFIFSFSLDSLSTFYVCMLSFLSLYWVGGLVAAPLWLDWCAPWLPRRRFGLFLAKRSGIIAFFTLFAYVCAAVLAHKNGVHVASAIFGFGAVARIASILVLRATPSPPRPHIALDKAVPLPRLRDSKPIVGIIIFTVLFKWAVNISSPFCLPYIVHDLKFDLWGYVWLTAVPFVGRYVSLSNWGLAARTLRPFVGLQVAMAVISINPILWALTRRIEWLGSFEFVSGLMWGGFDLCSVLVVQNFWPGNARRLSGLHMALSNGAALLGAWMGSRIQMGGSTYLDLFYLSANMRFTVTCAFAYFLWRLPETRIPLKVYGDFLSTVLTLRPSLANIGRVIPVRRGRFRKSIVEANRERSTQLR